MAAKRIIELPFVAGQDEGVDPRLLGVIKGGSLLVKAQNVRLRKDGRLGSRRDYAALTMTTPDGGTLVATDVVNVDGRLAAFGSSQGNGFPTDVFEFLGTGTAKAWTSTEGTDTDIRLPIATRVRDLGRVPSTGISNTVVDVAAANGFVCLVSSDGTNSYVHCFRADTGQPVMVERSTSLLFRPRVVAIGNVFYVAGLTSAGTSITLRTFDPAANTATQVLATPFAAGATIVAWDMTLNVAATELIMAAVRSTPTSQILRVSSAGTTLVTITGPATLADFCSVYNDGTTIVYVDVVNTTHVIRATTFSSAGGAALLGPAALSFAGGTTTVQQVGLQRKSATVMRAVAQIDSTLSTFDVRALDITLSTLATVDGLSWGLSYLTTKPLPFTIPAQATPDTVFGGRFLHPDCTNFLGEQDTQQVLASKDHYFSGETLAQLGHIARDTSTGAVYWPQLTQDVDSIQVALCSEVQLGSNARFQTASLGGHLYMALGTPAVYDGKQICESGFPDIPVVINVQGATAAGTLTLLGLYSIAITWEWTDSLGHLHTSAPSAVSQITLVGTQNTITINTTTPHSIRANVTNEKFGGNIRTVAWVTVANGTVLQRATVANATFGAVATLTILGPDTVLAAAAVLYTQGARGSLSGPLPFETVLPSQYVWASKERVLAGGQPYTPSIQESRPLFTNEPIQWSLGIGFFSSVRGDVTAVFILDEQRFVCTSEEIFVVGGEGIDDNGNGVFGPPIKLPAEGGCRDWRSVVECSDGVFYQSDAEKLFLQSRGSSAPTWIGQPVRDTLAAFPIITSATLVTDDETVCFTCNNTGGTDGRIIAYDLRAQQWYVDTPLVAETYRGSCRYQGRHVLCKASGAVFQQLATETPGTFIPVLLETADVYPAGPDGWAQIYGASLLAEYRGDCVLTLSYSLDNGLTFTTVPNTRQYTISGLTVGTRVRKTWTFGPFQTECIRLRFQTSALSGAATAGLVWQSFGVLAEPVEGLARVPAADQG